MSHIVNKFTYAFQSGAVKRQNSSNFFRFLLAADSIVENFFNTL